MRPSLMSCCSTAVDLGDLDLGLRFAERRPGSASADALIKHAPASGRRFPNFVQKLSWAQTELLQVLRNRSGYINVHTEDISQITDRFDVLFSYEPEG
jgi:hypothetical protein